MGLLDRIASRRSDVEPPPAPDVVVADSVFATKALSKFLAPLLSRPAPVLLDLGPVVGGNVSFFGDQLSCKIFVEDLYADIDRHVRDRQVELMPVFLGARFPQPDASVDGVLCWDVIDYLDRSAAQALAGQLTRMLKPEGALLGFFATAQRRDQHYTKFAIVDTDTLRHRTYPAARGRQSVLLNRDIIKLFPGLRVSDSFLLQNNSREILFRKPG